ncbi:hypothetical protein KI387_029041 [Taxus chinensis]|uniref:Phytosulfokine n=1 Tax=Taxus chinensis TaxID=29808 RepID=A0AA38CJN3_TAXCH|nr:hypothetical protein KI387_029041 [Taxus chinensis]
MEITDGKRPYRVFMLFSILLLLLTFAMATRPLKAGLVEAGSALINTEDRLQRSLSFEAGLKADELEHVTEELSCDNIDEDECLNRRTLAAHTDYIYTQHHKHP